MTNNLSRQTFKADIKTAGKMGFAIAGVTCFANTFVQGGSSVLRMKFSANNPRHRKPLNSCVAFLWDREVYFTYYYFLGQICLGSQRSYQFQSIKMES